MGKIAVAVSDTPKPRHGPPITISDHKRTTDGNGRTDYIPARRPTKNEFWIRMDWKPNARADWSKKETRIAGLNFLLSEMLEFDLLNNKLRACHFKENGFGSLLHWYDGKGGIPAALEEAGLKNESSDTGRGYDFTYTQQRKYRYHQLWKQV